MKTDKDRWLTALRCAACEGKFRWKQHALIRTMERRIPLAVVENVLCHDEMIELYPDAYPLPACLLLHKGDKPLHVVAAFQEQPPNCSIVTVYRPTPETFESDWRTRKSS